MANQYLALCEHADRLDTNITGPYLFLPTLSDVQPESDFTDKPRVEFRGQDTALGSVNVQRTEQKWSATIKCYWYPGKETGLLFKHTFGNSGARVLVDTTAYKGLLNPVAMPFGAGMPLGTKAIALIANTDEGGVTKSQLFGGGRVTSCKISCKGTDDIELEFTVQGWFIGPVDQAAIGGVSFPPANPFNSSQYKAYIGGVPVRTGSAPNYTDLAPGTAVQFSPDSLTITINNGLKDKVVGNGIKGPTKTYRDTAFGYDVDCPVDYEDPASGFSSADEFKKLISGPAINNLFVVFDTGELAGAATQTYTATLDLPRAQQKNPKKPDRSAEGKTPGLKMGFTSLCSTVTGYPVAMQLTDKASAY